MDKSMINLMGKEKEPPGQDELSESSESTIKGEHENIIVLNTS